MALSPEDIRYLSIGAVGGGALGRLIFRAPWWGLATGVALAIYQRRQTGAPFSAFAASVPYGVDWSSIGSGLRNAAQNVDWSKVQSGIAQATPAVQAWAANRAGAVNAQAAVADQPVAPVYEPTASAFPWAPVLGGLALLGVGAAVYAASRKRAA